MFVILSQKIDTESTYEDDVFKIYHYPSRYRNQLHVGDQFVYYQGNRYKKKQRYYFGMGKIGKISCDKENNYYAELEDCIKFENIVPIYLEDGGYIEQLGYEEKRNSPPWQSSIRPLSVEAYNYIIGKSGITISEEPGQSEEEISALLKDAIRKYFRDGDSNAINEIYQFSGKLVNRVSENETAYGVSYSKENINDFKEYLKQVYLKDSLLPVLILSFIDRANEKGEIALGHIISFFKKYYRSRKKQGKTLGRGSELFLSREDKDVQIKKLVISNPINELLQSEFFVFNSNQEILCMNTKLWKKLSNQEKSKISQICIKRIELYFYD